MVGKLRKRTLSMDSERWSLLVLNEASFAEGIACRREGHLHRSETSAANEEWKAPAELGREDGGGKAAG